MSGCFLLGVGDGVTANGNRISLGEGKNILKLDLEITAQPCEYTKECWISCFPRVDYMVCELYLSKLFIERDSLAVFSSTEGHKRLEEGCRGSKGVWTFTQVDVHIAGGL